MCKVIQDWLNTKNFKNFFNFGIFFSEQVAKKYEITESRKISLKAHESTSIFDDLTAQEKQSHTK